MNDRSSSVIMCNFIHGHRFELFIFAENSICCELYAFCLHRFLSMNAQKDRLIEKWEWWVMANIVKSSL